MEGIFFSESPEWAVRTCEQSVEISTMANRFRHQEVERSPVLTLGPATAGVQPIAQACVPILSVSNCRSCEKRGTPGRPRGLPRCPRTEASLTEDYGQLVMSFSVPKHHLGCKAGSEEPLAGPLLCEDVVPIVVTELSFLSPPRKFIGEVAYPFLLGSSGGVGVLLLFQRIRIVAFVNQCVG